MKWKPIRMEVDSVFIAESDYYDNRGRTIQSVSWNILGEYDRFGNPSRSYDSNVLTPERAEYSYDASGRLHSRSIAYEAPLEFRPDRPMIPDTILPWIPKYPIDDTIPLFDSTIIVHPHPILPTSQSTALRSRTDGGIHVPVSYDEEYRVMHRKLRTTAYCGNYEYSDGKLTCINTPVGYYENGRHYFYLKDYQGNIRCTVADNDSLVSAVHYYPGGSLFGESHGYWAESDLFQGGKLESYRSHQFYDLQNRHYDPVLPHFISVDKKAESYYQFNYYNYGLCNPVRYRDPDGNDAIITFSGTTITVSADIYLMGDLATRELADTYKKDIMDNWGKFTTFTYDGTEYNIVWDVNVSVKQYDQPIKFDGKSNYLEVSDDPKKNSYVSNTNRGIIRGVSRKKEEDFKFNNPMSHEFGHILGQIDRYDYNTYKSHIGWNKNIMAEKSGNGYVEYRNLKAIFEPGLKIYHNSERQQKAINHPFLNSLRGTWNYIWRINNKNRER